MKITIEGDAKDIKELLGEKNWNITGAEIEEENGIFKEDGRITLRYNGEEITIADSNYGGDDKYYTYDEAMELQLKGIHLPSIEEWQKLLKLWCGYKGYTMNSNSVYSDENNDIEISKEFAEDFNIPFAGGRSYLDANVNGRGGYAGLWSSTPGGDGARRLSLDSSSVCAYHYSRRAYGLSVRCFKNS